MKNEDHNTTLRDDQNLNMNSDLKSEDTLDSQDQLQEMSECPTVINKRQLGRLILKYCGNEGNQDDVRTASLRRLLQEFVDYLPNEPEHVWQHADVTIYDIEGNVLNIQCGNKQYTFILIHGLDGKTTIRKVDRNEKRWCIIM